MKKTLANLLLLTLSTLFIVFLIEISLRLYAPIYHAGYVGVYQYDDEIGSILKPGLWHFNTTDYQQEVRTNELGSVNFQRNFNSYKKKIYALGDSYTQGTGLPSDASYPAQTDLLLNMVNGEYKKEYAVVNLGLAAFGAEQAILTLSRFRDKLGKPDFILYMGASNDYLDDLKFTQGYKHRNFVDGSPVWGIFVKPLQWLRNDFQIGKRLFFFVDSFRIKGIKQRDKKHNENGQHISVAELQVEKFEKLLRYSQELGADLIVSWANMPDSDGSYEYLQDWARENNVPFADWYPKVASVKKAMPDIPLVNSHSGGHYRTWVNQIMARAFAREVTRETDF